MGEKYACFGGLSRWELFKNNFSLSNVPTKTCKYYSAGMDILILNFLLSKGKRELPHDWEINEKTIFDTIKPSFWKFKNMCEKKENVSTCFDVPRKYCRYYEPTDCFIATVIYGTEAEETNVLREWRDKVLSVSTVGKLSIWAYYRTSPKIANLLNKYPKLKKPIRLGLDSLVKHLR